MATIDNGPFVLAQASIASLGDLLGTLIVGDVIPALLLHPPSRRAHHRSMLHRNLEVIDAYCEQMEVLTAQLVGLKASLRQQRTMCASALAPMSALPNELLREIFALVAASTSTQGVCTLTWVCGRWRSIALAQSKLWARLRMRVCDGLTRPLMTAIDRAANQPLQLEVPNHSLSSWDYPELPTLGGRLETLTWLSSADIDPFFEALAEELPSLPALHSIKIHTPDVCETCGGRAVDRFAIDEHRFLKFMAFPSLRNLEIVQTRVNIPTKLFHRIERLVLASVRFTLLAFRFIFQQGRSLRHLVLSGMNDDHITSASFQPTEGQVTAEDQMQTLPCLEKVELLWMAQPFLENCPMIEEISLQWVPDQLAVAFVTALATRAPNLKRLEYQAHQSHPNAHDLNFVLDPLAQSVQTRVEAVPAWAVFEVATQENVVPIFRQRLPLSISVVGLYW
ncbi:hypothetical protein DL93DRAFT_2225941 [Clavulina sp. PMI_390]|nr:hypothetical protein DL93DRAFT_2225941 [Clavulina sp. PMI_390]